MTTQAKTDALAGRSVLISETTVESMQLVGRAGPSSFLLGGARREGGEAPSGPNPYELLAAALGACTAMTMRLYADGNKLAITRLQVSVAFHRGEGAAENRFDRRIFLDGYLSDADREALLEVANACPVGKVLGAAGEMRTFIGLSPDTWSEPEPAEMIIDDWWRDALPNIDAD